MIKKAFRHISFILIICLIICMIPFSASAAENNIIYQNDTFTKIKDGNYFRYYGPTGNVECDPADASGTINTAQDFYEAYGIDKKDLASTGSDSLPYSVDLSKSKYFPPIGNQGGLGSCATFSSVYYQFTYAVNQKRDVATTADNVRSPQIVYNFINASANIGTNYESNYRFLKYFGAPTMSLVPYNDQDDKDWHTSKGIWREAIRARLDDYYVFDELGVDDKQITSPDDPDLIPVKTALSNGQILGYSTYVSSWKSTTLKTNSDAPENDKYAKEECVTVCDGSSGPHAMTLVGYNDNIWIDINNNDKVDNGEMGAFKIANSWGDSYCNDGFVWVAYDALNKVTSVEGGPASNRQPIFTSIRSITVRDYNDLADFYIEYTINTAKRTQHEVYFTAEKNGTIEKYKMFYGSGGYTNEANEGAFDGSDQACDGTFVCPLDNIASEINYENFEDYTFNVMFKDTLEDSNPLIVKDIRLVNENTGESYIVAKNLPCTLDGSSKSFNIKNTTLNNKVIYYVGYDNPTLHYKTGNEEFTSVIMDKNLERIGATHKYVINDADEDITLYFTDDQGNVDDNNGHYYTAKDTLNFYRTENAREKLSVTNVDIPEGSKDPGIRFFFDVTQSGGYEPFNYQYTIENLETHEVKFIPFDYAAEKSHVFYNAGDYRITAEVQDQAGDIVSFTKDIKLIDLPFEFISMDSNTKTHFVGDTSSFTAKTQYEKIISHGPIKSLYKFDVKDADGNIVYTTTNKSTTYHLGNKKSTIDFEYIPEKAGNYTLTVSSNDENNEYAEFTTAYIVFDKTYGDSNSDGTVNVMDATYIQRFSVGSVSADEINNQLADCDDNNTVNVMDATYIQRFTASLSGCANAGKIIEYIPPEKPEEPSTEPPTVEPSTEPVVENKVTFTNSFNWSGTIYCYYWNDNNHSMTSWPGGAMQNAGKNDFNETMYTFTVPKDATYIIFSNGSNQTTDISYSGGIVKYYPISQLDSKGHYMVRTW